MLINNIGLGVMLAIPAVEKAMEKQHRLERPRIKRVPTAKRHLGGCAFGLTSWECVGRGVVGYGSDAEAAYRNWRRGLADKKRHAIVMARANASEAKAVSEGRAYVKPDGRVKYRPWKFWKQEQ